MVTEILCELKCVPKALRLEGTKWVKDPDRLKTLRPLPEGFMPQTGDYAKISRAAVLANTSQIRSGFHDYLFYPETVSPNE